MQINSKAILTARNLITLQRLYRFREFTKKNNNCTLSKSDLIKSNKVSYTFYGNIGFLAPTQRIILREQLKTFAVGNTIDIDLIFFPSKATKTLMSFSNRRKLDSLLKGTIYQITLSFFLPKDTQITNQYQQENVNRIIMFIDKIKTVSFFDDVFFDFTPYFVTRHTFVGAQTPIRYTQFTTYAKKNIQKKDNYISIENFNQITIPFFYIKHILFFHIITKTGSIA
jgi:hypothetical protein